MKSLILIVVIVAAAVGVTYLVKPAKSDCKAGLYATEHLGQKIVLNDYVYIPGDDGKNALELLQDTAAVLVKQTPTTTVESINGNTGDETDRWNLYHNAQGSQTSPDKLITADCDAVEFI